MKRKSKFTNRSSRVNDKRRKKFMRDNFDEAEKEKLKKVDEKRKKMHNNLEEEKKNIQKTRITKVKMQSVVTMTMIKKIS